MEMVLSKVVELIFIAVAAVIGYYLSSQREDRLSKDLDNYEKWIELFKENDDGAAELIMIESYDSISKSLYLKTDYRSRNRTRASIVLFAIAIALLILGFVTLISQGSAVVATVAFDLVVSLILFVISILLYQSANRQSTVFAKRYYEKMDAYRIKIGLPYSDKKKIKPEK